MKKNFANNRLAYNEEQLLSKLNKESSYALRACEFFEVIDSTNQYLLSANCAVSELPRVCFANRQTQGRGRRGKQWQSNSQCNIYMSLAYLFESLPTMISNISLVIGIAISRVLKTKGIDAAVKWPNDVLVGGKKIAGILIESKIKADHQIFLVVGVGLNVDMLDSGRDIKQAWTDVCSEVGASFVINRSELAGEILSEIMQIMAEYKVDGFDRYRDEFAALDLCYQQAISVQADNETIMGKGLGVDEQGRLCVDVNGEQRRFYAAEVSIRVSDAIN